MKSRGAVDSSVDREVNSYCPASPGMKQRELLCLFAVPSYSVIFQCHSVVNSYQMSAQQREPCKSKAGNDREWIWMIKGPMLSKMISSWKQANKRQQLKCGLQPWYIYIARYWLDVCFILVTVCNFYFVLIAVFIRPFKTGSIWWLLLYLVAHFMEAETIFSCNFPLHCLSFCFVKVR